MVHRVTGVNPWANQKVILGLAIAVLAPASRESRGQTAKFAALFTDGTYIRQGRLTDGHDPAAQPKIDGRPLHDPKKPVRWLRNPALAPGNPPRSFVELAGGDRVSGEVVAYRGGDEALYQRELPHFILSPGGELTASRQPVVDQVPIVARWVRRIVWQSISGDRYQPGTLFYRDGRRAAFRRVRFTADRVLALLESGPQEVAFGDLAELHMPRLDPWEAYFEQLAIAAFEETTRLVTLETDDGLRITTSTARYQPRYHDAASDPNNWDLLVQPAWALRPFWVSHARVHTQRFFAPHEVPLSLIEPAKIEQRSTSGSSFSPRIDRNVRGEFLETGARWFAWGLGTHANCVLAFPLPDAARAFRCFVALDKLAGGGGCAKARVFVNTTGGKPLYESKLLIGSDAITDTDNIALASAADGQRQLLLVSDAAHRDRPPGADPLDIRDFVDWLEPIVELDPVKLKRQVNRRLNMAVPAWEGWDVSRDGDGPLLRSRWDESDPRQKRYVSEIACGAAPVVISSRQRVEQDHDYLLVAAEQTKPGKPVRLDVRIAGAAAGGFDVPQPGGGRASPLLVPVAAYRGREVPIEVVLSGGSEAARVRFGALRLVGEPDKNRWVALRPRRVQSAEGTILVIQPDASVLASGPRRERDQFAITVQTNLRGITAFRLEALTDPAIEGLGPGRGPSGGFALTDFRVWAAPVGRTAELQTVPLANATADYAQPSHLAAHAIDDNPTTAWAVAPALGQPHVAVFETRQDIAHMAGAVLTFQLDHRQQQGTLGRFRISATTDPRPIRVAEGSVFGLTSAADSGARKVLFDDERQFIAQLTQGRPNTRVETKDKFSGTLCLRIKPGEAGGAKLPGMELPIRAQPGPGEYRYLRFAWRKQGGTQIALALAANGKWELDPAGATAARKLVYFAGPLGGSLPAEAIAVHEPPPSDWVVVTRDLFVDFGPITLTGLSFQCPDGENALFDQIQVARSIDQFAGRLP